MFHFRRRKGRVLLLDDDASMRRLVTKLLEREGYTVDVVWNGLQAIDQLGHAKYDALLLDLMMPHEGGMTVISHLRQSDPPALAKVLLLTATGDSIVDSLRSEVFGVVRKPFEPEQLVAAVGSVLGKVAS